jgi:hypothetical protein
VRIQQTLKNHLVHAQGKGILFYSESPRACYHGIWSVIDENNFSIIVDSDMYNNKQLPGYSSLQEMTTLKVEVLLASGIHVVPTIVKRIVGNRLDMEINGEIFLRQLRSLNRLPIQQELTFTLLAYEEKVSSHDLSAGHGSLRNICNDGLGFIAPLELPVGILLKFELNELCLKNVLGCILWKRKIEDAE